VKTNQTHLAPMKFTIKTSRDVIFRVETHIQPSA